MSSSGSRLSKKEVSMSLGLALGRRTTLEERQRNGRDGGEDLEDVGNRREKRGVVGLCTMREEKEGRAAAVNVAMDHGYTESKQGRVHGGRGLTPT
ncbi:hypothetical protein SLE2022_390240 [Rubroshorea leprosula]